MKSLRIILVGLAGLAALLVIHAQASADTVVRGFKAEGNIVPGNIVALSKNQVNTVVLAPSTDPGRIYGVVIKASDAPITVQGSANEVFVATSGSYPVIATTEKGDIQTGDYISLAKQDGVAAKATEKTPFVLGKALEDFSRGTNGDSTGLANIQISPGANPFLRKDASVPKFLRSIAETVANKQLSAIRIYAAVGVFIIIFAASAALLSVGVRSGMVAIGRNPLSKHSVIQSLGQVIMISSAVFIVGLFGIYLLLRL